MDSKRLKNKIFETLKIDSRLWDEKTQELNQTLLLDLVENIDKKIIQILLEDDDLRNEFFVKIKDAYVFKNNDFRFFIEENKVYNSYTKYKNRIGLSDGKKFLKDSTDVVLNFPYKDCILKGGQSKEEGFDCYYEYDEKTTKTNEKKGYKAKSYNLKESKRNEIFFNQVLAQDEIDRLFDKKAFVNWKRYTKDGEQKVKEIQRDEKGTIKENLIIKGNNLLALHSLKSQFKGKVKLIYIDPPYNTKNSNNNTFCYNNNFNHSTWLTFMKNRLEVAKDLLRDDGGLIVAIDDNERDHLGVLLKEIFINSETHCITIVHNPRGVQGTNFSYTHEYAFFIIPKGKKIIVNQKIEKKNIELSNFRNWGSESNRLDAKNCFYPIILDKQTKEILGFGNVCDDDFNPQSRMVIKNDGIYIYPVDDSGIQRKWRYARQSVESVKHLLRAREVKGIWDIQIGKDFRQYPTVWKSNRYDANEYGTKLVKSLVPNSKFDFPKSLYNVYDCIYAVVGEDKNAIVLDYHAGSGTTAHAVLKLNEEDEGNRKFILCEQMDYIDTITCQRVQKVIEQQGGGDFIYFELAKSNEKAKEEINTCEDFKSLEKLFDTLYETYFLNYNLKIKEFKEKVIKEDNFKALPLEEQKKMFLTMLDLNQMYVQKTEMEDKKFEISDEDKNLTNQFYNSEQ